MSDKLSWLRLRELTGSASRGRALFQGTLAEQNRLLREFQNFLRQAKTYWDSARAVEGSAAALLYYYAILNLAKAELLQTNAQQILGTSIHHGISSRPSKGESIRGDKIATGSGVFSLLFKKRTGVALTPSTIFPLMNVLALIPEIGHEMGSFGTSRPGSVPGYYSYALNETECWTLVAIPLDLTETAGEPATRRLLRSYAPVSMGDLMNWRDLFALSTRLNGRGIQIFESKKTHSRIVSGVQHPDIVSAVMDLPTAMGEHLAPPLGHAADFVLVHSLRKSDPFVLPLSLARYAAMFHLSSLVRYRPSKLDPSRQGEQALLMDSLATELPSNLLADATEGITGRLAYFEAAQYRV